MLIFAHRGASKYAPENTVLAFNLAFTQQADGIEFDTYQHDDAIVVFHDRRLTRTTGADGFLLDTTLSSLRALDAGQGERIPVLTEALCTIPKGKWCNIEVKHLIDADKWVREAKKAAALARIDTGKLLISSFNHHWLRDIAQRWPEVKIGALTATYAIAATQGAQALQAHSINVDLDVINKAFVDEAHQHGLAVYVYTVDYRDDMLKLKDWGVDGIFTNVPDIAVSTLA